MAATRRKGKMNPVFQQRTKAYKKNRVCASPGCTTIISMYNSSSYCRVHAAREFLKENQ